MHMSLHTSRSTGNIPIENNFRAAQEVKIPKEKDVIPPPETPDRPPSQSPLYGAKSNELGAAASAKSSYKLEEPNPIDREQWQGDNTFFPISVGGNFVGNVALNIVNNSPAVQGMKMPKQKDVIPPADNSDAPPSPAPWRDPKSNHGDEKEAHDTKTEQSDDETGKDKCGLKNNDKQIGQCLVGQPPQLSMAGNSGRRGDQEELNDCGEKNHDGKQEKVNQGKDCVKKHDPDITEPPEPGAGQRNEAVGHNNNDEQMEQCPPKASNDPGCVNDMEQKERNESGEKKSEGEDKSLKGDGDCVKENDSDKIEPPVSGSGQGNEVEGKSNNGEEKEQCPPKGTNVPGNVNNKGQKEPNGTEKEKTNVEDPNLKGDKNFVEKRDPRNNEARESRTGKSQNDENNGKDNVRNDFENGRKKDECSTNNKTVVIKNRQPGAPKAGCSDICRGPEGQGEHVEEINSNDNARNGRIKQSNHEETNPRHDKTSKHEKSEDRIVLNFCNLHFGNRYYHKG